MSNIFDDRIKEALENAQKLQLIGEPELAKAMSVKCVKKVAQYQNEDMIALFYGEEAYQKIENAADAAKYIFIVKCAINAYDMMMRFDSAASSHNAWAVRDENNSNKQLWDFFLWLKLGNRSVEETDHEHFRRLLNALSALERPHFKINARVEQKSLLDIIRGLVSNSITITNNGELK